MAPVRNSTLFLLSSILAAPHVLGQVNPAPPANNPAPPPGTTTNVPTDATTTNAATTAQTSAPTSTGTSAATSDNTSTNAPTTSSATSAATSATSRTTTSDVRTFSATFATTNNPSTSTQPPLPTLSGVLPPPLIVPDTSNAPFMQKSDLPEGTVFICVGAALGFLGLCVLAWRGLVAWSLRRSVKRAAETAYAPDSKSMFGWGGAPLSSSTGYKSMYTDSNMSLEMLSSTKPPHAGAGETHGGRNKEDMRHDRRSAQQHNRRSTRVPSSSDLFFSPTNASGNNAAGNRSSGYMPAGFYAPGTNQANSGNPVAHLGRGSESAAYNRLASRDGLGTPSPPDSPSPRPHSRPHSQNLRPVSATGPTGNQRNATRLSRDALAEHDAAQTRRRSRQGASGNQSMHAPQTGRTPSGYFEDLLENHGHGPSERF